MSSPNDSPEENIFFDTNSFTNEIVNIDDSVNNSFKEDLKIIPISLVEILLTFNRILTDYLNSIAIAETNAEINAKPIEDKRIDKIRDNIGNGTINLLQNNCITDLSKLDAMFDNIKGTFDNEKKTLMKGLTKKLKILKMNNNLKRQYISNYFGYWNNMQNIAFNLLKNQHDNKKLIIKYIFNKIITECGYEIMSLNPLLSELILCFLSLKNYIEIGDYKIDIIKLFYLMEQIMNNITVFPSNNEKQNTKLTDFFLRKTEGETYQFFCDDTYFVKAQNKNKMLIFCIIVEQLVYKKSVPAKQLGGYPGFFTAATAATAALLGSNGVSTGSVVPNTQTFETTGTDKTPFKPIINTTDSNTYNPTNSTYNPTNSTYNPTNSTYNPTNSTYNPTNSTYYPIAIPVLGVSVFKMFNSPSFCDVKSNDYMRCIRTIKPNLVANRQCAETLSNPNGSCFYLGMFTTTYTKYLPIVLELLGNATNKLINDSNTSSQLTSAYGLPYNSNVTYIVNNKIQEEQISNQLINKGKTLNFENEEITDYVTIRANYAAALKIFNEKIDKNSDFYKKLYDDITTNFLAIINSIEKSEKKKGPDGKLVNIPYQNLIFDGIPLEIEIPSYGPLYKLYTLNDPVGIKRICLDFYVSKNETANDLKPIAQHNFASIIARKYIINTINSQLINIKDATKVEDLKYIYGSSFIVKTVMGVSGHANVLFTRAVLINGEWSIKIGVLEVNGIENLVFFEASSFVDFSQFLQGTGRSIINLQTGFYNATEQYPIQKNVILFSDKPLTALFNFVKSPNTLKLRYPKFNLVDEVEAVLPFYGNILNDTLIKTKMTEQRELRQHIKQELLRVETEKRNAVDIANKVLEIDFNNTLVNRLDVYANIKLTRGTTPHNVTGNLAAPYYPLWSQNIYEGFGEDYKTILDKIEEEEKIKNQDINANANAIEERKKKKIEERIETTNKIEEILKTALFNLKEGEEENLIIPERTPIKQDPESGINPNLSGLRYDDFLKSNVFGSFIPNNEGGTVRRLTKKRRLTKRRMLSKKRRLTKRRRLTKKRRN